MNVQLQSSTVLLVGAAAALGVGAFLLYRRGADLLGRGAEAANQLIPYINPADPRNVVYSGVNQVGAAVTGDQDFSLGGWLYDATHADPVKPPAPANISTFETGPIDFWDSGMESVFSYNPRPFSGGATGSW